MIQRSGFLSAFYGVVSLDQVLAPYDLKLSDMNSQDRKAWDSKVSEDIKGLCELPVYICGEGYYQGLPAGLAPLPKGVKTGRQMQWMKSLQDKRRQILD